MPHSTPGRRARQIELVRTQFAQADGLPFADVLPAHRVERAIAGTAAAWREVVFTPLVTLGAFLGQVISADRSCRAAVARVLAWRVSRRERPCSPKTGPYCKARGRLPEALLGRLIRETGQALHRGARAEWLWNGRRVKVA